jgi:hypothetical protein
MAQSEPGPLLIEKLPSTSIHNSAFTIQHLISSPLHRGTLFNVLPEDYDPTKLAVSVPCSSGKFFRHHPGSIAAPDRQAATVSRQVECNCDIPRFHGAHASEDVNVKE